MLAGQLVLHPHKKAQSLLMEPKDYGIKHSFYCSSAYPAPAIPSRPAGVFHAFIPFPFGLRSGGWADTSFLKIYTMKQNVVFFHQLRRRRRAWVSYSIVGCLYDTAVCIIYRCPVVAGIPQLRLSWQHKILPA